MTATKLFFAVLPHASGKVHMHFADSETVFKDAAKKDASISIGENNIGWVNTDQVDMANLNIATNADQFLANVTDDRTNRNDFIGNQPGSQIGGGAQTA